MKKIILASSSPRRKELLELHKIDFIIDFQTIDEVLDENLALPLRLEKLAYQKALPISSKYPKDIVIGADTMVCLNKQMLGKPKNRQEAFNMLNMLSNHTQTVYSAVAIIDNGKVATFCDDTKVTFKKLTEQEINDYLDTDEWQGKAGAYAIQGIGKCLVAKVEGDIETVIGLPVKIIERYLNFY
ncbi:septum formation protein Maf [Thomasclavelia cocleata]|uniref:dTTP/UTP pyrophosphatase n=1 Tax=Thomasclavelia cocleata TaxID=69824 RepID=A0A829Z974_9FIRM|nr:Maf family protein [Thomasclavelia cocleata]GFI40931.1 septum formation protein Maf [Thomasclavelia cocleata]